METIYYSLDAKRLTVCGEAAGRRASTLPIRSTVTSSARGRSSSAAARDAGPSNPLGAPRPHRRESIAS